MTQKTSPNVTFLVRLKKIADAGLMARDVLVLYTIMAKPGVNGNDITKAIGIQDRSSLQSAFRRLERLGMIEDRRRRISKAVPTIFYVLPAGIAFWEDLTCERETL